MSVPVVPVVPLISFRSGVPVFQILALALVIIFVCLSNEFQFSRCKQ